MVYTTVVPIAEIASCMHRHVCVATQLATGLASACKQWFVNLIRSWVGERERKEGERERERERG